MGVVNVTPDSFSDGGKYLNPADAERKASQLVSQGADIIDIGAQSTRPMAKQVEVHEELNRLIPALSAIKSSSPKSLVSVDTFQSKVAIAALNIGADWINDISGGRYDPDLLKVVADAGCPYILTHSRGSSKTMDSLVHYNNVVLDVINELLINTDLALKSGILPSQIVWDPGLGFAKTNEQNLILLRNIEHICDQGFPVLVGPSKKRFIGDVLCESNPDRRMWGTAAVVGRCVFAKVAMVRVHDVNSIYQTIRMMESILPC